MTSSSLDNYVAFEDAVRDSFNFLEQQYAFRLSQINQVGYTKIIRYETSLVYVNLMYGPPAYEPEMSIGRIGIDDQPGAYSLGQGDLVLLKGCANWKWNSSYPNHLTGLVSEFARLLKECGGPCLKGDGVTFEEMKARRDDAVRVWHQEEKANRIRKDVPLAWNEKDYRAVVSLYESIKDMLTDSEKKKLEYAKKHLSGLID